MTAAGADFLSRLAAKAVGAAPLVEPRLASRFEANAEGAGVLGGAADAPIESSAETENAWSASSLRRAAAQPVRNDVARPEAMPDEPHEAQRTPARARKAKAVEPIAEVAALAEAPAPPLASPARPATRAEERLPAPEPVRPLLVAPPPQPGARPQLEPQSVSTRALPALPARADQAAPDRRATAAERVSPASPAKAPPILAPQAPPPTLAAPARAPGILPHRSRRDRELADAMPQPPAVTITIGRVEVRAHTAAAPSARPAPQPRTAPQSLSDYFRQRNAAR